MKKLLKLRNFIMFTALMLLVSAAFLSPEAFALDTYISCTEGEYYKSADIDMDGAIQGIDRPAGNYPKGMTLHKYDSYFVLEGTPEKRGSYNYSFYVNYEDGSSELLSLFVTVNAPEAPSPSPGVKPESSPAPDKQVKITKHPTGEYVDVGGSAVFIAKADNATGLVWRIVSPDTTNTVLAEEAADYFSGLAVSGENTGRLVLSNIPLSLDGWAVEAKFLGQGGPVFSYGAVVHVSRQELRAPSINKQPRGLELKPGGKANLSVNAGSPDGAELKYQWYSNSDSSKTGAKEVPGANSASFTPPETEGTVYYYAAIWAQDGELTSPVSYTSIVPIRYEAPPQPSAAPSASPAPLPSQAPESEGGEPDYGGVAIDPENEAEIQVEPQRSNSLMIAAVVALAVLLAAVIVCLVLILIKKKKTVPTAEPAPAEEYNALHDGVNDKEDYENYVKDKK